eukprot:CAMPEP_0172535614 /NCGR_PEP_ID=MMETSP1067-20121228/7541_1 /TAXON_ID=265564 ORGANISM="Thalassiosira punctigera, Strain Tpunct2005C2" /NCGR_SAMPLE_ID=MMETSP1067 /ASSEMBLY_ACC=CAM_ASM_000444 /LENGTH=762 /DNA_ID=CAMNT_0013320553 /DNA_START=48 /DNA_END=2336 /DNA_ORIENTATION=-
MAAIAAIIEELLPGLDEDIAEYVTSILSDDGALDSDSIDDTTDAVSGLLAEYCEENDDEDPSAKAAALVARISEDARGGGENDEKAVMEEDAPVVKRIGGMSLAAQLSANDDADDIVYADGRERSTVNAIIDRDGNANAKGKGKKGGGGKGRSKPTASEIATAQIDEIEAELREARVAAVRARAKLGAYRGSLDAKQFTLPNPGGGAPLLEDAACRLVWGKRYGLIGRNGMGKSTMLRAFAARRVGDVPPNVSVHYVSQEVNLTEDQRAKTPVECVVDADVERTMLKGELAELEARAADGSLDAAGSGRHEEVLARLDEIGGESAPRRADALLANLGFSEELRARPLSQLSGGWRVRTMLAAAIFAKPDLLLLDEPTNHLSILAVMWLARELSTSETWKERIVVVVSHDRHFMDEVCTDCLHISGAAKRLTQSRGNYTVWHKRRKDQQALFAKEQKARQDEIDRLREYAGHGFKYGGSASQINKMGMKAKQADKLEEAHAEHAEELAALQEDVELPIRIAAGGELDGYVVQLKNVGFGYPNGTPKRLFRNCEFGITSKSRIVLLGENGNGKTTLVKLIMGELEPCEGEVKRSPHARYALVNQHHADQIDLSLTPLEFLLAKFPGDGSYEHMQKLRGHLSSCGVTSGSNSSNKNASVKDLQNTPASALSGGQRSRVALAAVSYAQPHVLVLDEPTNNLDLESVATLAESVRTFKGAVICVSHDQFFVQTVANEAWVVNGGKVKRVESFEAYRGKQLKLLKKSE